jgi:hypothetical protein
MAKSCSPPPRCPDTIDLEEAIAARQESKPNGFIKIDRELWRSEAVEGLSPGARLLLVELLYRYTGKNNGRISMSWAEGMASLQCSRATVARKFGELPSTRRRAVPPR